MKVFYVVTHIMYREEKYTDEKEIGIFDSLPKAQRAIQERILEPGFRVYPNNFIIREMFLDNSNWTEGFSASDWIFFPKEKDGEEKKDYYILKHARPYSDDYYEEVRYLGVFSTKKEAMATKKILISKAGFKEYPKGFFIEKCGLNRGGWIGGFVDSSEVDDNGEFLNREDAVNSIS